MFGLQQMVLQRSWKHFFLPYNQSPSSREAQGGATTSGLVFGRYGPGVLQLRHQKRLPPWVYTSQVRYCGCAPLPPAMCCYAFDKRHELGRFTLAAAD